MAAINKQRVYVGMSGGVDSSVAALLLCQQGYEVVGATLDIGLGDATQAAAQVCRELGIAHIVVYIRARFRQQIMDSFVRDYANALTPSPCLICNPRIKFAALEALCEKEDDLIATGHYVDRLWDEELGCYYLTCGDAAKDQSYFLCLLSQRQISRCLFPLGATMSKPQVRALAQQHGLSPAQRRDSFDVCFVPGGDYRAFLHEQGLLGLAGDIVDSRGRLLGRHQGLLNYTIGQRRGLELALGYPAYVLRLEAEQNRLVVGRHEELYNTTAQLDDCVFQSMPRPQQPYRCLVRVRHKARLSPAVLHPQPEAGADSFRLEFDQPEWGLTPGQYAAFYQGQRLLGGGRFHA